MTPEHDKSCGCVFCDLGIQLIKMRRQYIHYIKRRIIVCERAMLKPAA